MLGLGSGKWILFDFYTKADTWKYVKLIKGEYMKDDIYNSSIENTLVLLSQLIIIVFTLIILAILFPDIPSN